jgi:hypothetical protein
MTEAQTLKKAKSMNLEIIKMIKRDLRINELWTELRALLLAKPTGKLTEECVGNVKSVLFEL